MKFDGLYMSLACKCAEMSKDNRAKVGAFIIKDDRPLSMGWNGRLPGEDNTCQDENNITLPSVIHAESNAILKAARDGQGLHGATLYCTLSPCVPCAVSIIAVGIKRVVYKDLYRNGEGLQKLIDANIIVEQLKD